MERFLGITGTPGTGKKTIAPLVAEILGLPLIGLNEVLSVRELATASRGVDSRMLRRRLLKRAKGRTLVFGHMIPDVLESTDVGNVVVLRCDPSQLKVRLSQRGYSLKKVTANVEAELIGVVSAACISKFGRARVSEFDTTAEPVGSSARAVARLLSSRRLKGEVIDWVPCYSSAEKLRSLLSVESTDSAFT